MISVSYRQDLTPCTNDSECFPHVQVPSDLVSCINGSCLCLYCFIPNTTTGHCVINKPCLDYDFQSNKCVDLRKSRVTALVLSVLLSSLGAANLYINQLSLGLAQLSLFVLLAASLCCCITYSCCLVCREDECEDCCCCECCDEETQFVYSCLCVTCLALLLVVVIVFWWAVDLAVFALNDRGDGNGCPLKS